MNFPIRIIWEGKASSTYDQATIERRLEVLRTIDTEEARQEIEFLEKLKQEQETMRSLKEMIALEAGPYEIHSYGF